jgi:hypothetical protein
VDHAVTPAFSECCVFKRILALEIKLAGHPETPVPLSLRADTGNLSKKVILFFVGHLSDMKSAWKWRVDQVGRYVQYFAPKIDTAVPSL